MHLAVQQYYKRYQGENEVFKLMRESLKLMYLHLQGEAQRNYERLAINFKINSALRDIDRVLFKAFPDNGFGETMEEMLEEEKKLKEKIVRYQTNRGGNDKTGKI